MVLKFSWVQPNFQQGPKSLNAYFLPYSAGVVWSYVISQPLIKNKFILDHMIWRRESVTEVVNKLKDSDVVAFSTYVWNKNYNYTVAAKLKEVNPDIFIIFGGPEPPITDPDFYERFPFIDVTVKQEGEQTLANVLANLDNPEKLKKLKGILYNNMGETIDTGPADRIQNLDVIPSPYTSGIFDKIIEENPEVTWSATLETNRGCPYACTFCDWGSLTYNKVKKFNLERVMEELEWCGKHGMDHITIADANFGIFPERDILIAEKLIEIQKKYGSPTSYTVSYAKNQKKEVVDIVKKLVHEGNVKTGLNLSLQTMDDFTLEIIKRKNLESNKVNEVFELCEENNIPMYTELILGLPGETPQSWRRNYYGLFKIGNHTGITTFQCQLLENAELNLLQRKLYKMKTQTVYDYFSGSYNDDELKEGLEVVVSTSTMDFEQMLDANIFSCYINTFHIMGFTNYVSRIVCKLKNIDYEDFYTDFYDFIMADTWFKTEFEETRFYQREWMTKGQANHPDIGSVSILGWNLQYRTVINIHRHNRYDQVFDLIKTFISKYELDQKLVDELILFQNLSVIRHSRLAQYPLRENFNYSFLEFLLDDKALYEPCAYDFIYPERTDLDLERFSETVYYGRRRNFGKSFIVKA